MDTPADIDVRCSAIVFRGDAVLLVHRDGTGDWVLPGGTPRPGESMAACARRETQEETGLVIDPARVAFIAETLGPGTARRAVDLVFLATPDAHGDPVPLSRAWTPGSSRSPRCPGWMSARRWPGTCVPCTPAAASPRPPTWATCTAPSTTMAWPAVWQLSLSGNDR